MTPNSAPENNLFQEIFNASPSALLVVDDDVRIQHCNKASLLLLGITDCQSALRKRGGEVLHCLHALENPDGCGRATACTDCVVRNAVGSAMKGEQTFRRLAGLDLISGDNVNKASVLVTASPFSFAGQRLVLLALEDISELITLRRLLPICAKCKKIRDEKNYWQEVESYFRNHIGVDFSHGLCPECIKSLYPELGRNKLFPPSAGGSGQE